MRTDISIPNTSNVFWKARAIRSTEGLTIKNSKEKTLPSFINLPFSTNQPSSSKIFLAIRKFSRGIPDPSDIGGAKVVVKTSSGNWSFHGLSKDNSSSDGKPDDASGELSK